MFGSERQQSLLLQIITYSEQYLKKDFYYFGRRGKVRMLGLLFVNISLWMLLETAICARATRLQFKVL